MLSTSACSEGETRAVTVHRKQKRMLSNLESARRSRMRKQKYLDDLMGQVRCLRKENNQILTAFDVTMQHYIGIGAENSVLRSQILEINTMLQYLNEILHCYDCCSGGGGYSTGLANAKDDSFFVHPCIPSLSNKALMTSDMFM